MIKHRVLNGAWMIGAVLASLFLPVMVLFMVLIGLSVLMIREFYGLLDSAGLQSFKWLGLTGVVSLVVVTGLQLHYALFPLHVSTLEILILALVVIAVLLRQCTVVDSAHPLTTIGSTLFGLLYIGVTFNFYTKLLLQWPETDGRWLLFYMIMVVKVTDMAAYFTGSSLGRHKFIPRISPAKTWEGCIGGVLGGLLTSLIVWQVNGGDAIGPVPFSFADAIILGVLLPIIGIIGDLVESMIKRAAHVKDSGHWIKGMGGVLDIMDSLLLAGPVVYLYLVLTAS